MEEKNKSTVSRKNENEDVEQIVLEELADTREKTRKIIFDEKNRNSETNRNSKKSRSAQANNGKDLKEKSKAKTILARVGIIVATALFVIVVGLYVCLFIIQKGPSTAARNLFVNSAMESSAGKFMARLFFSNDEIAEIRKSNSVVATDAITDTSLVNIGSTETTGDSTSTSQDIEIVEISSDTYRGKMMIVKDPSRVTVGTSGEYGSGYAGKTVSDMIQSYGGVAGVNGGGFEDAGGVGNGGTPVGVVISDGKLKYGNAGSTYEVIGFDNSNKLVVGYMTAQHALDMGVRDALSFGPILIVNGEASEVNGDGSGLNPRTAIGQRADGAILLLVIDGRQVNSIGASYADLIDVMLQYGAVNAANLDGGSSSLMYYNGEYINSCSSLYGPRAIPTCIVVK